jgi:hypothetical protein
MTATSEAPKKSWFSRLFGNTEQDGPDVVESFIDSERAAMKARIRKIREQDRAKAIRALARTIAANAVFTEQASRHVRQDEIARFVSNSVKLATDLYDQIEETSIQPANVTAYKE